MKTIEEIYKDEKKTVKDLIKVTSKNFNIPDKCIRSILAQV